MSANSQGQNQTPSDDGEEQPLDIAAELRVNFPEGYYLYAPTGEVRRASIGGARVMWFEADLEVFLYVESRSAANSRRMLEELIYLPNFRK